jgi:translation initiation factor IF-3
LRNFSKHQYQPRKFYQLNFRINAPTLRVIDDQGKQVGVISKQEALNVAGEKGLDLVLIAPNANPPVAKIIDFKKFLYQEEKKQKEARKGQRKGVVKDIKLSLFIGPADFERMVNKGKQFIDDGNQLRINLGLKGREMGKKTMAFDLIKRYISGLGEVSLAKEPRLDGRVIRAVMSKKK